MSLLFLQQLNVFVFNWFVWVLIKELIFILVFSWLWWSVAGSISTCGFGVLLRWSFGGCCGTFPSAAGAPSMSCSAWCGGVSGCTPCSQMSWPSHLLCCCWMAPSPTAALLPGVLCHLLPPTIHGVGGVLVSSSAALLPGVTGPPTYYHPQCRLKCGGYSHL